MDSPTVPAPTVAELADDGLPPPACNQALIIGELVTEPEWRTLPGGSELFSFSLTVRRPGKQTTSVPLVWYDPPKRVRSWKTGATIAASGPVVRRFYQARGTTASRTEVSVGVAELVTRKAGVQRILSRVITATTQVQVALERSR